MALQRLSPHVTGQLKIIDMLDPYYTSSATDKPLPELEPVPGRPGADPSGTCACCGHQITWRVVVQDEAGKAWLLGRRCASLAEGLDKRQLRRISWRAARAHKAERARRFEEAERAERLAKLATRQDELDKLMALGASMRDASDAEKKATRGAMFEAAYGIFRSSNLDDELTPWLEKHWP